MVKLWIVVFTRYVTAASVTCVCADKMHHRMCKILSHVLLLRLAAMLRFFLSYNINQQWRLVL